MSPLILTGALPTMGEHHGDQTSQPSQPRGRAEPTEKEQQLTEAIVSLAFVDEHTINDLDIQRLKRLSRELRRYSERV